MSDIQFAHQHAKTAAEQVEAICSRLSLQFPDRPAVTGSGDAYFAHYWAKRAATLAPLADAELGRLGYPQ